MIGGDFMRRIRSRRGRRRFGRRSRSRRRFMARGGINF